MGKIIIINGSPRKKSTYKLLEQIGDRLSSINYDIEFIHLGEVDLSPCNGCESCLRFDKCSINDDYESILNRISSADGIVIGSPVYLRNVSGTLKNLFDRTCKWYHRTQVAGIPILAVVTTASSGSKQTINYINDVALQWGAIASGGIKRNYRDLEKRVTEKEISRFIKHLNMDKEKYRPSIKQIIEFNTQKILAIKIFSTDLVFWEENGWINNNYYYDCKIGLLKYIIGKLYFSLLNNVIPNRNI